MPTIKIQLFLSLKQQGINLENSGCIVSYKAVKNRQNLYQVTYILPSGQKGSTFVGKVVHTMKARSTSIAVRGHLDALAASFTDIRFGDLDSFYLESRVFLIDPVDSLKQKCLGQIAYNRITEQWDVTRQDGRVTNSKTNSFSAVMWLRKEHEAAEKIYNTVSKTLQNRFQSLKA